jgi:hypothetical protein
MDKDHGYCAECGCELLSSEDIGGKVVEISRHNNLPGFPKFGYTRRKRVDLLCVDCVGQEESERKKWACSEEADIERNFEKFANKEK